MDATWKCFALLVFFALPLAGQTTSGVMSPVLTRAYDNSRTGATPHEIVLTQTLVAQRGIKRLFSLTMDGDARGVEAQPLILPKVNMKDGNLRDVVLLSSMSNSVYAFDANTGDKLWAVNL